MRLLGAVVLSRAMPERSSGSISSVHSSEDEPGLVPHLRPACLISDGMGPRCDFLADLTLIPEAATAAC